MLYTGPGTSPSPELVVKIRNAMQTKGIVVVAKDHIPLNLSLSMYDAILFPGGSGAVQRSGMGQIGVKALRAFVSAGGGYLVRVPCVQRVV